MEEKLYSEGQKCFTNERHPRHTEQTPIEASSRNESADFKILAGLKTTEIGCQKSPPAGLSEALICLSPRPHPPIWREVFRSS